MTGPVKKAKTQPEPRSNPLNRWENLGQVSGRLELASNLQINVRGVGVSETGLLKTSRDAFLIRNLLGAPTQRHLRVFFRPQTFHTHAIERCDDSRSFIVRRADDLIKPSKKSVGHETSFGVPEQRTPPIRSNPDRSFALLVSGSVAPYKSRGYEIASALKR